MSISIQQKTDYSALFNTSSANSAADSIYSLSSEYQNIKSGNYGKLLKAYYSDSTNSKASEWLNKNLDINDSKKLSQVKSDAVDVKENVSVINNKLIDSGDKDKLASAVSDFVESYNSMVDSASNSANSSVSKQVKTLTNNTYVNSDVLSNIGITVKSDNTLTLDTNKLKEASAATLKSVFTNSGSFGDTTSSKASMIYNSANSALTSGGTYNASAISTNNSYTGSLFESYN